MKNTGAIKIVGVIPVRYGSKRFPGKALYPVLGKPVVQHVYERAVEAEVFHKVFVATDAPQIESALKPFGTPVARTSSRPTCGTERVEEVARRVSAHIFVNIQGDEPCLHPGVIKSVALFMVKNPGVLMCTAAVPFSKTKEPLSDPNVVKVVLNHKNQALYFSRLPIPYERNGKKIGRELWLKHLGIYAYQAKFLKRFSKLPRRKLEQLEKLEQLRALENGFAVHVLIVPHDSPGVDTKEDALQAEKQVRFYQKKS